MASFLYLELAAAMVVSYGWLQEVPALFSIAGGALALIGVGLTKISAAETVRKKMGFMKMDKKTSRRLSCLKRQPMAGLFFM